MSERRQMCTMWVGDIMLGVDVVRIQEVIGEQPTTNVPMASSVVGGLINLRGQIITAIDLRTRFCLPERQAGEQIMNVVVVVPGGAVSLLVDKIGDVVEVDLHTAESTPTTVSPVVRALITGIYKSDGALLLALDVDCAVSVDNPNTDVVAA